MNKSAPTRTTNPIHFEDLDPKRFEDLVRELIYDFRDWQTIEATGRGGDDDGFDVRAYERTSQSTIDDDGNEVLRPMDGNVWMIQCKREKEIGPKKIGTILEDIDRNNPPYGYILAAAANFSKKSHDRFREELTALGVMEFYLWGKASIETELYQPKNDRILFTFFGISKVRRKRSRATEIRSEIVTKNKIMRILGDDVSQDWVLVRDSEDREYPYDERYIDFDDQPRWKELEVKQLDPRGIIVSLREAYAWFDPSNKTYDFAKPYMMLNNPQGHWSETETEAEKEKRTQIGLVHGFWDRLPQKNQVKFHKYGIIQYSDILAIDDKGDNHVNCPHIFVEFVDGSPITRSLNFLMNGREQVLLDDYTRKKIFPEAFAKPPFGKIYDEHPLELPDQVAKNIVNYSGTNVLYDIGGKHDHLVVSDVAVVRLGNSEERFIQVTHRREINGTDLLENERHLAHGISLQIGREVEPTDTIRAIEFRGSFQNEWKRD